MGPSLHVYGTPVQLAVIVVASAGRGNPIPGLDRVPELLDQIVPGFQEMLEKQPAHDSCLANAVERAGVQPFVLQPGFLTWRTWQRFSLVQHGRPDSPLRIIPCWSDWPPAPRTRTVWGRSTFSTKANGWTCCEFNDRRAALMDALSSDALAIWKAGLDAVRSDRLVLDAVQVADGAIRIQDQLELPVDSIGKVWVLGGGKAGAGMALGLEQALQSLSPRIQKTGLAACARRLCPRYQLDRVVRRASRRGE